MKVKKMCPKTRSLGGSQLLLHYLQVLYQALQPYLPETIKEGLRKVETKPQLSADVQTKVKKLIKAELSKPAQAEVALSLDTLPAQMNVSQAEIDTWGREELSSIHSQ